MNNRANRAILLVEDNEDHAEITRFHITDYAPEIDVIWLGDGEQAMHHIEQEHTRSGGQYPWLILLDIKLPKYDGHEVLAHLKAHESMRKIPVVMFTTSNATRDIDRALKTGANSYVQKPVEAGEFGRTVCKIIDYWKLNQHDLIVERMNADG